MMLEKARKFETGVASRSEYRSLEFCRHQMLLMLPELIVLLFLPLEAYLSIIMHKYSSILNGLTPVSSQNRDRLDREFFAAARTG
jgi:hypothetical protein